MTNSVRVLLVDDSPLALKALERMLSASPGIEVVGTARNGREALELLPALKPDVVCTDYMMPQMDGLELTRAIMSRQPCPILVISSVVGPGDGAKVFPLLQAGAMDVFSKPRADLPPDDPQVRQLAAKIKLLSRVPVVRRSIPAPPTESRTTNCGLPNNPASPAPTPAPGKVPSTPPICTPHSSIRNPDLPRIVAIGASTGGPQVLTTILSALPANFPWPVLCVQHISAGFLSDMVSWLNAQCRVQIQIAQGGEAPQPGVVYFPHEDRHLELDARGRLWLSSAPPVDGHRPSVTATFASLARSQGRGTVAVLLTGMGQDGALGLKAVADSGGITMAQDEASCAVFGMPGRAVEMGAAQLVLPPDQIARKLLSLAASAI